MTITLNGEKREFPDGITVEGLLLFLSIQPQRVAVELNLDIVRKGTYGYTVLKDGDTVEVVSFMGGGSGKGQSSKRKVQSAKCKMMVRSKIENG